MTARGVPRAEGLSVEQAQDELGFASPLLVAWERQRLDRRGRHHLAVDAEVQDAFWRCFQTGGSIGVASRAAGVGRSTGYRWWRAHYGRLREQGMTARAAALRLRIPPALARQWEDQHRRAGEHDRRQRESLQRRALRSSARHAEELTRRRAPRSDMLARDTRYWELMRAGLSNTAASTILGVHRKTGARIRARRHQQTAPPSRPTERSGRYLSLRERLQIADLLRLDYSIRVIAGELGRYPSTIKRELDRHRDEHGRYLPHHADHAATQQRRRPRQHKLIAQPRLRTLVQRKLNRCWSPDEISGWLRRTYPTDPTMRLNRAGFSGGSVLPVGPR